MGTCVCGKGRRRHRMDEEKVDYPFKVEYAKSNRASCKGCREKIDKESLRIAKMVQSPHFDGKVPNWFHYSCFWKKNKCTAYSQIGNFDALRWDDQKKIKDRLSGDMPAAAGGAKQSAKAATATPALADILDEYSVEYAKSSRSKCRGCEEKIEKDCLRIGKSIIDTNERGITMPVTKWHHLLCFCKPDTLQAWDWLDSYSPQNIPGFALLSQEDRSLLTKKLGPKKGKRKGNKTEGDDTGPKKQKSNEEIEEEKVLEAQSKCLWTIRDKLYQQVPTPDLKDLLEANSQAIPSGESKLLDHVADQMMFGALEPCPECEGQLSAKADAYRCNGNISGWTKCIYSSKEPKRKPWTIPEEFQEINYLKNFKFNAYNKGIRVFPSHTQLTPSATATKPPGKPLQGVKIALIGKLGRPAKEVTAQVSELGGVVVSKVTRAVGCCISTAAAVEKVSKKMEEARDCGVHVVSEEFLEVIKGSGGGEDLAETITKYSIAGWGTDPKSRLSLTTTDGPIAKSGKATSKDRIYTMAVPEKMKMKVKGGAAIDTDSGLEDVAHVFERKGLIHSCTLGLVDVTRGTNSYYKLQLLEHDNKKKWYIFRSWGRVGTSIGGNKLENFYNFDDALELFRQLYGEKTGNNFGTKNFVKQPSKFYPLDIDYGQDEEKIKELSAMAGTKSKLPQPIQNLIKMIFDVDQMKKTMVEFEIDLRKMPLGKLSKKQIESAYAVLNELQQVISGKMALHAVEGASSSDPSVTAILDGSNRFYTLIPHDFGMQKPPMLDNLEIITSKTHMLDSLMDIEVAYSLLKGHEVGEGAEQKDPLDANYEKLNCEIENMEKESEEFSLLQQYVANTHASTHQLYTLDIQEIFKLKRQGERQRYKPFKKLHNRMLLWHGSRVSNYAGILSQGLRIAPPEAPVTGYMFGKGIYFADMVSKSANYCHTSPANDTGMLLLCEVALGDHYELKGAKSITKLPVGKHSTKGVGGTHPDPGHSHVTKEGVTIPLGKGVHSNVENSSLLYNEYIVYDVAQVEIKYLLQLKFNFKNPW